MERLSVVRQIRRMVTAIWFHQRPRTSRCTCGRPGGFQRPKTTETTNSGHKSRSGKISARRADSLNLFFPKLSGAIFKLHANHRVVGIALSATAGILKVQNSPAFPQEARVSCRIRESDDANPVAYPKRSAIDVASDWVS